jgi:hypothetical protein
MTTAKPDLVLGFLAECFNPDYTTPASLRAVYNVAMRHNPEGWTTWLALKLDAEGAS